MIIKQIKFCTVIFILLIFATGCASHYTNKELSNLFSSNGFNAKETDQGVAVLLPEVFFEFDSIVLTHAANEKLLVVSDITNDPRTESRQILIEGHTDSIGDVAYNQALSLRRADAVADRLVFQRVNNARITRRGYGGRYPAAPNTTPDGQDNPKGRALNRRVVIILENPVLSE